MYSCQLLTHIHTYTIRLIKNATAQTHNDYNYFDHAYCTKLYLMQDWLVVYYNSKLPIIQEVINSNS